MVATFEALGAAMKQSFFSPEGLRLFGGHTPRVTGAQTFAAMGVEINKLRILARHSSDAILRYVADAPLKSLRSDLGLPSSAFSSASSSSTFAAGGQSSKAMDLVLSRLRKLETAMVTLSSDLQTQAQELVGLAAGYVIPDARVFVQNTSTSAVHLAKEHDNRHTICGWDFGAARKYTAAPPFHFVPCLNGMPGHFLCKTCLPTERALALALGDAVPDDVEMSGDEVAD